MQQFEYRHRVRYRECDPMGVVYHTHYIDYLEEARTEALRDIGLPYKRIEELGIMMPVVDLAVRYFSPARYDDVVVVNTIFDDQKPGASVKIRYEVHRESNGDQLLTGHVTLCFINRETGRPTRAPKILLDAFDQHLS